MSIPDLNLLIALDMLLREGNVTRAAEKLGLSASAMSRTLSRLRETTGDPLLVRAGRSLVPTPLALDLQHRVGSVAALALSGLRRLIAAIVPSFPAALCLARATDLIAAIPERQSAVGRIGMYSFDLPVTTPTVTVSQLWHPRSDADLAHRWLRHCVQAVCAVA